MYYRIAEIILYSEPELVSFTDFRCREAVPDVTLEWTDRAVPEGEDLPAGEFFCRRVQDGWYYYTANNKENGLFAEKDYTRLFLRGSEAAFVGAEQERFVRVALECRLAYHGCVSVHASCIELDGEAYAFTGPSGSGKSTRAMAWSEAFDARLISGDRPMIHVRTREVYGVPWDGKERCFRNVRFPMKVIGEIRRSSSVYVRALSFEQRRRLLLRQCFMPMWDTETAVIQMANIHQMVLSAELVRAFCGPAAEDARQLHDLLDEKKNWLKEETDLKAKSGFVLRNVVNEHILMPTGDNISHFNGTVVMNEVSAFVWEKLQEPASKEDLVKAVVDEFEVEEDVAARDLEDLLEKFKEFGIITEED